MSDTCVFCAIVAGTAPAEDRRDYTDSIVITPLNPVTPGHRLIIPKRHVPDAAMDPDLTGRVAADAARYANAYAGGDFNLIVNCGSAASQTVWHLHWHFVPRRRGDGLSLPWTGQEASRG